MRITLCIILALLITPAFADVRKEGDKYIENKTVEIDHGTIKDIEKSLNERKKARDVHKQELEGYQKEYGALIDSDEKDIAEVEEKFKSYIDADDAANAETNNAEASNAEQNSESVSAEEIK